MTLSCMQTVIRLIAAIQRDRISYREMVETLYGVSPPRTSDFLSWDYSARIERAERSALFASGPAPRFSVIIPTYNRGGLLSAAIDSVLRQTDIAAGDFEIIIVDNGSRDDTERVARRLIGGTHPAAIHYIRLKMNYGADFARNVAILHARGTLLAFTDDDCIVPEDWLSRFAGEFAADPGLGGVGGFKVPRSPRGGLDPYHRYLMWGHSVPPHIRSSAPSLAANRCGLTANVCYRSDAIKRLGGFNAYFKHIGFEEFKHRAHAAGLMLVYEPRMVEHFADISIGVHVKKCLAQGWDRYLIYLLYPTASRGPTFLSFLGRTKSEIARIMRSKETPPLFTRSVPDIGTFIALSVVTNFFLWLGKYWVPLVMLRNPGFASHDVPL